MALPDGSLALHKRMECVGNDKEVSTCKRFLSLILKITLGQWFSGLPWQSMLRLDAFTMGGTGLTPHCGTRIPHAAGCSQNTNERTKQWFSAGDILPPGVIFACNDWDGVDIGI